MQNDLAESRLFLSTQVVVDVSMLILYLIGDYLCVKMTNKKKVNILVFFRLNDTGVPVEQLEFTDTVTNVAFEPSGDRFTVVLGQLHECLYSLN